MSRSVLVVDDNTELASNIAEILDGEGWDTYVAFGPNEALETAQRVDFDAAIVDIRMPHMDGVALQGRLRTMRPNVVVILMTAFTNDGRVREALDSGVRTVLTKPFSPEQLLSVLSAA